MYVFTFDFTFVRCVNYRNAQIVVPCTIPYFQLALSPFLLFDSCNNTVAIEAQSRRSPRIRLALVRLPRIRHYVHTEDKMLPQDSRLSSLGTFPRFGWRFLMRPEYFSLSLLTVTA